VLQLLADCLDFAMPEEIRTRLSQNGRIVIPATFREAMGIEVGDEVVLRLQDDELRITTKQRRIQRAQERAQRYLKPGTSLVDELIAERREAAKHE
jgi:AbrB family looped-hinge helix DNA binding protein